MAALCRFDPAYSFRWNKKISVCHADHFGGNFNIKRSELLIPGSITTSGILYRVVGFFHITQIEFYKKPHCLQHSIYCGTANMLLGTNPYTTTIYSACNIARSWPVLAVGHARKLSVQHTS